MKVSFWWRAFIVLSVIGGVSCSDDDDDDDDSDTDVYDAIELLALDKYMEGVVGAERQDEGYYIVAEDLSNESGTPGEDASWIYYNITSRSLDGDICNTRNERLAKQMGTFTYVTRYVPATRTLELDEDDDDDEYDEALEFAMKYGIEIGGEKRSLYEGNKFTIYSPSALNGDSYNGSNGYAGQYTLASGVPIVSEIEIVEIITNSKLAEQRKVDIFMAQNGSSWRSVTNSEVTKGIYIDQSYTPNKSYNYVDEYPYYDLPTYEYDDIEYEVNSFADVEDMMMMLLNENGGYFETDEEDLDLDDGDTNLFDETTGGTIKYILRTLDGFIVDSNIEEINMLKQGDSGSYTSIYYSSSTASDYIDAWEYAMSNLEYGKWAAILTTSEYAYGESGMAGSSSSTDIDPNTPLLFLIYIY